MKQLIGLMLLAATTGMVSAQDVQVIKLNDLNTLINKKDSQLKVINFWASWCGPCIKEMPYFESLNASFDNVDVHFVSVDFIDDLEKAKNILQKKQIKSNAYLLDEKDANKYITSIDDNWTGAIPATLFVDASGNRYFYEEAFEQSELEDLTKKYLPTK